MLKQKQPDLREALAEIGSGRVAEACGRRKDATAYHPGPGGTRVQDALAQGFTATNVDGVPSGPKLGCKTGTQALHSNGGPCNLFSFLADPSILFFFQAEDGIRDDLVTGVQTCALPIFRVDEARRLLV